MSDPIRVMIEKGPKQNFVAVAFDWPGWERGAKTEEAALETLERYRSRYRRAAELAGLLEEFDAAGALEVVERIEGTGTTDFHGISAKSAAVEYEQMTEAQCERKLALLRACWTAFDETYPRVSAELRKGPRGGGRDRDQIMRHTYGAEREYSQRVGVRTPVDALMDSDGRQDHREAFVRALREYNAENRKPSSWTIQFIIRRSCYHMLDHAWELEDKDLTDAS